MNLSELSEPVIAEDHATTPDLRPRELLARVFGSGVVELKL